MWGVDNTINWGGWKIAEPKFEYTKIIASGRLTMLGGSSFQRIKNENTRMRAFGYKTDKDYSGTNGADPVVTASYHPYATEFWRCRRCMDLSAESFLKKINWLSFGKLRGSYGIT